MITTSYILNYLHVEITLFDFELLNFLSNTCTLTSHAHLVLHNYVPMWKETQLRPDPTHWHHFMAMKSLHFINLANIS